MIAVRSQLSTRKRMENGKATKKAVVTVVDTAVASKKPTTATTTTTTTSTSVEERRTAVDRVSKQTSTQYNEDRNSIVTTCELQKYRKKNIP